MNNRYLKQLRALLLHALADQQDVHVYLFGSRATGSARLHSDVDIGLLSHRRIPLALLVQLRELAEESSIPYKVDIVDLQTVNDSFRKQALKGAEQWK